MHDLAYLRFEAQTSNASGGASTPDNNFARAALVNINDESCRSNESRADFLIASQGFGPNQLFGCVTTRPSTFTCSLASCHSAQVSHRTCNDGPSMASAERSLEKRNHARRASPVSVDGGFIYSPIL